MGRNQQSKGGGYAGNKGSKPYASGGKGGGNKKSVDAATALGLGLPQQNTMLAGMAGLGMAQPNPLDSLFGTMGANTMAGLGGLGTGLQSANSGNDLLQLASIGRGTSIGWIGTVLFMVVLIVYDYASGKMKLIVLLLFAS